MPDPTPTQREAIQMLDRNLLVSAGAGSGKTTVLVNRFLRMVAGDADPTAPAEPTAPVDGVLTITFTDKAAGEMRERIAAALAARGLVEERRRLEVAHISTIHGFCRRLLQENPFEAGLDPRFATIEGARGLLMREECFEQVVERLFETGDRELAGMVLACQDLPSRKGGDDALAGLREPILAAIDAMRSLGWEPSDLQAWVDEGADGILRQVAALVARQLSPIWEEARRAVLPLRDFRLWGEAEEARSALDEWARAATPIAPDEPLEALVERAEELRALRGVTGKAPRRREYYPREFEELKEAQERIQTLIKTPLVQHLSLEREIASAEQAVCFLRLALAVWQEYEAAKEAISSLDFNDLQARALKLLETSEGVRRRYQRKFRYLMVDEFQDTDRLQRRVIDLLRGESNFFVVGDVKQSIYGWRNADVRIFMELDRQFSARERLEPDRFRRLSLADNFRSRPEILTFVNSVFADLWVNVPEGTGAVPFEPLESRGRFEAKEEPSVEVLLVRRGPAAERRQQEADLVARRLKELHDTLPLTSHRRRGERVRWSDCLILLRALTHVSVYEEALVRHGIPYFIVGGRGYYARREIRDLVCLLRVIVSPLDDVATAAALRSPFAGVSLDALAALSRRARELSESPCLYRAIEGVLDDPDLSEEDRSALRRFYALIERLRGISDRMKPGWLLDQAIGETHYDARILAHPDGRRRLANIRKLVQLANAYPAPDVAGLVRYLESLSLVSTDEGDAPSYSEASDVVRIMSVHRAKGLEAPVVFLPDLGRQVWTKPPELVDLDPEERLIGMQVPDGSGWEASVALELLHERKVQREREEEERLLYVAMTRAEEHLVLAGPMPPGGDTWGEWLYGLRLPLPGPPDTPQVVPLPGTEGVLARVSG
jgi:ATP-dependent helicase/nuclease subunit A